jgi:hypothetical protein
MVMSAAVMRQHPWEPLASGLMIATGLDNRGCAWVSQMPFAVLKSVAQARCNQQNIDGTRKLPVSELCIQGQSQICSWQ